MTRGRHSCRVGSIVLLAGTPYGCTPALESKAPVARTDVNVPAPEPAPAKKQQPSFGEKRTCAPRSFESAWPHLRASLESGDLGALVSARHGLFVTDNPGAFEVPSHYPDAAKAAERVPSLSPEHYRFTCPTLNLGARPSYSCEDERWSAEGCWHTVSPDFSMAEHYDTALEYEALPTEFREEREHALEVDGLVEHGVYVTDKPLGVYFGRVDCHWTLLAVDTVTPCSA